MHEINYRKDDKGRILNPLICSSSDFSKELKKEFNWFSGVPDSIYRKVLPDIKPYIPAPRENHAFAMAFGARLGGLKPCVLIQNSGLGLSGDVFYGLFHLYNTGIVTIVTLRGELEWEEPQHLHWGQKTRDFLSLLDIHTFDFQQEGIDSIKSASKYAYENNKPAAIIVHRGNIDE